MIATLPAGQHQRIPVPRTSLIGRREHVSAVIDLITQDATPLLTLTGPGGVGKTRVAIQVAMIASDHFDDGALFVSLATAQDTESALSAIGHALGMREFGNRLQYDQIVESLKGLHLLLVLDNFEQIRSSAFIISDLLRDLPRLSIVVTSRVILHLADERVYPVPPLSLPSSLSPLHGKGASRGERPHALVTEVADSDAIRLFATRAEAANPAFSLTEANAAAIVEVCERVDGLPLAIELAAARTSALSITALRDQLESAFLATLGSGGPDRPERQRTMAATIAWSYELLLPSARRFLQGMSTFAGGFVLEAADALWREDGDTGFETVSAIATLVDSSLLKLVDDGRDKTRYLLLDSIGEFARAQRDASGDGAMWQARHARWCLELAETARPELHRQDQAEWISRLDDEHANLGVALEWSIRHDPALGLRLVNALWLFWYIAGRLAEGQRWLERAIAAGETMAVVLRANALNNLGNIVYELGDLDRASQLYERSRALRQQTGDREGTATSLNNLGMLATARGEFSRARTLLEESLAIQEDLGQIHFAAPTMNNLGDVAIGEGDGDVAHDWNQRALSFSQEQGDTRRSAHSLHNLGLAQRCRGDDATARGLFERSLQLFREVNDTPGMALVEHSLGRVHTRLGQIEHAKPHFARALDMHRRVLDRRSFVLCLEGVALLAVAIDKPEIAVNLMGTAAAMRGSLQPLQPPVDRDAVASAIREMRRQMGTAAFDASWLTGSSCSRDHAIETALMLLVAPPSAESVLSRREREVLELIAQGLSNQQIADALYISVRTVKAHVTSILTKLDLPSRAAAVSYAHRNGLV